MNLSPALIDRIVADVLADVGSRPHSGTSDEPLKASTAQVASSEQVPLNQVAAAKAFDVDFAHASVLTGDMLDALAEGTTIRIAPSTVLTPSARDTLRVRSIRTTHGVATAATSTKTSSLKPHLLIVSSTRETRSLGDALKKAGWSVDYPGCDGDAIAAAKSAVCRGDASFVAIVAPKPNRTAQRLNRTRNVLATALFPETAVNDLVAEGDWNVACLAAERWASFRLRRTLEQLAQEVAK